MIVDFLCADTERIYHAEKPRKLKVPNELLVKALTKLRMIDAAEVIYDLYNPPSNHLEALDGKRKGQYSIRINIRWRICFRFEEGNAYDLEIVDYH